MRLKVFLICFIFIESAIAKRFHRDHDLLNPMLMEIIEMFRSLREHSNWLVSDELFLYDYKETLPIFSQKSFNISVSNVSMRDYRKKSSITYEDLVVTCLYGKYFNLALPSKTENAIEFFGNIEASYPFSQSNGTFAITYDGVKFHLKADREDHIIKVMRYENTNENLDIPLHIQIRNAEFKTETFEPLIYEKFDHWIDGNEPLRFMMSRCFNYRNSHSSVHYETKYADYIISVSGLSDFQKVILVNDATTMKVELHASPLKGTVKFTNSSNTQASDFKIQSSGLRVFGDFYISNEGDHSRARRAKMRVTLNDFNITNTSNSTTEQLVTLGRHTIGAVRDHIQNSIKESLLEEWLND